MKPFRERFTFEERKKESKNVLTRYPGKIPIIAEPSNKTNIPILDKQKFLVPGHITVGQFIYILRQRIKISTEKALFLFVGDVLPTISSYMNELYDEYSDSDGFLYITYSGENTFG